MQIDQEIENSATWTDHQYCYAGHLKEPWMAKIQTEQLKIDYFVACSSIALNSNLGRLSLGNFSSQIHLQAKAWLS